MTPNFEALIKVAIGVVISVAFLVLMTGCASNDARSLLDRIEFDDDEVGCARMQGNADLGGFLGVGSTSASLTVIKRKSVYTDAAGNQVTVDDLPDC